MASAEADPFKDFGDDIDRPTFDQILEMDDDEDDRDFSRSIVYGFFEQADTTMDNMDDAVAKKDLQQLSSLGHFLKGSAATLGLSHVRDCCEHIQHEGDRKGKDDDATSRKQALDTIQREIKKLRKDYSKAEKLLRKFYGE